MPQIVQSLILDLDKNSEDECKLIPTNCPWILTSKDESLTVIVTCLKRTFNFDLRVRVVTHPPGALNVSKQLDIDDHHPLLRSLTDARNLCEAFPKPHLNSHPFDIVEELMEYLDLNFN